MIKLPRVAMAGAFQFVKRTVHEDGSIGGPRVVVPWFPNVITDQGLDEVAVNQSTLAYCQIGSGNTPPDATDTELSAYMAGAAVISQTPASSGAVAPYYGGVIKTYRFGAGVGTGNIQEIGVGWAGTGATLFSRALIVDGSGTPITITKLANEILEASYWHRVYAPTTDVTGSINISGNSYNYTIRAAFAGTTKGSNGRGWGLHGFSASQNIMSAFLSAAGNNSQSGTKVYTGTLGTVLSEPSGTADVWGVADNDDYVPGDHERIGTYTWTIDEGNLSGGIRSIMYAAGWANYQIQFDPVIPKDNTNQLELTFSHSWARKTL